jgi:parallel beta-helix repeat protein
MAREARPRRGGGIGVAAVVVSLAVAISAAPAGAKTRDVHPGKRAIEKAVDRARAGDKLRIHAGTYKGRVEVDKRLKLVGVGGRPTLDARCRGPITVSIESGGVTLRHLRIVGAAEVEGLPGYSVSMFGIPSAVVNDVVVRETCPEAPAEYGINVFNSEQIEVVDTLARGGFTDAGIYVGQIGGTGKGALILERNEAFGNNKGAIVEFSTGGDIRVLDNDFHDNTIAGVGERVGLFIHDAVGVRIEGNSADDNGDYGFQLTSGAFDNVLNDNVASGNAVDLLDEGVGNCGSGNSFGGANLLPPC